MKVVRKLKNLNYFLHGLKQIFSSGQITHNVHSVSQRRLNTRLPSKDRHRKRLLERQIELKFMSAKFVISQLNFRATMTQKHSLAQKMEDVENGLTVLHYVV